MQQPDRHDAAQQSSGRFVHALTAAPGSTQHSILLAVHHTLLRQGLLALLAAQGEFKVAGQADDGEQALLRAVAQRPDLVLMDAALPDLGGFQAAAQIKRHLPGTRVVLLTQSKTHDGAHLGQLAAADAYVLHDASFEELRITLCGVMRGTSPLDLGVWRAPGERPANAKARAALTVGAVQLTACERSVLQLIAEGRTNRGAAEFLGVSPKTVEHHRASLMRKFELRSAAQMLLAAIDMGLVEGPAPGSRRAPAATCAQRGATP